MRDGKGKKKRKMNGRKDLIVKWEGRGGSKRNYKKDNKNSSGDEIANVNVYAVRPEGTRIR